jgi:phospholipid N-methyltransferase
LKLSHLVNFKTSGTILAATKYTINKILSLIPIEKDLIILEIGLGDGCISSEIISKMTPSSKFIGVELNTKFYSDLQEKINDKRAILINGSVLSLSQLLHDIKVDRVDVIISTLPLSFFNQAEQESIFLQISQHMHDTSVFVQAVHVPNIFSLLKAHFSTIKMKFEFRNLPPYLIYVCRK